MEFGDHLNYVLNGGDIKNLKDLYAGAVDGLEVSKICIGVHMSAKEGGKVIELDKL